MISERAGEFAKPTDLIDIDKLISDYYNLKPDVGLLEQSVSFGTSGHRGSSLDTAFNENHIVGIVQAIIDYRKKVGINGPIFVGFDTHGLSMPAFKTTIEVLAGNNIKTFIDSKITFTPTPAVSRAILKYNIEKVGANTTDLEKYENCKKINQLSDGIIITPSHNPPSNGGIKYNPPTGGPSDSTVSKWIQDRANEIITNTIKNVDRLTYELALKSEYVKKYDYLNEYLTELPSIINIDIIRNSGLKIGADPLGGAAINYWGALGEKFNLDLSVVNKKVDPTWYFMTLDWDEKIRMDCSSKYAMASLTKQMGAHPKYDIATGNDADADRHGIVTKDAGLMNPNHFLAVAISYLFKTRANWSDKLGVGKTLVSSMMIDNVASMIGRKLIEVPVGFKFFVDGLLSKSIAFGGEESAGATFLKFSGNIWSTDKDGIIMDLLAAEIMAKTGKSPSEIYKSLTERFGDYYYERIDAPATDEIKKALTDNPIPKITSTQLDEDPIIAKLDKAPGNNAPIGGVKICTENSWFAARPSGTENVYKIYAETNKSTEALKNIQAKAKQIVDSLIK